VERLFGHDVQGITRDSGSQPAGANGIDRAARADTHVHGVVEMVNGPGRIFADGAVELPSGFPSS
jgi:hypothetical protein